MSDLILHHYPSSPFSEKIRLILGYKQLAWKSVIIPQIMPKPDVVALTGGYRKTPFLQIGADIYCDSALICDVLEHRQPTPTLYPKDQKASHASWRSGPTRSCSGPRWPGTFPPKGRRRCSGARRTPRWSNGG
jgi:glutathione S-transferase